MDGISRLRDNKRVQKAMNQAFQLLFDFFHEGPSSRKDIVLIAVLVFYYPLLVTGVFIGITLGSSINPTESDTCSDSDKLIFTPKGSFVAEESLLHNAPRDPGRARSYQSGDLCASGAGKEDTVLVGAQEQLRHALRLGLRGEVDVKLTLPEIDALMTVGPSARAAGSQDVAIQKGGYSPWDQVDHRESNKPKESSKRPVSPGLTNSRDKGKAPSAEGRAELRQSKSSSSNNNNNKRATFKDATSADDREYYDNRARY